VRVLHVDHSGLPGGGQLGLARYARARSKADKSFLFLSGGPVTDSLREQGLSVTMSRLRGVSLRDLVAGRRSLRSEIDGNRPDIVVANSLRAAVAVALARPSAPSIYYARQDLTRASMGTAELAIARALVFPRFQGFIANSRWTLSTFPPGLLAGAPHGVAYPISGVSLPLPVTPTSSGDEPRLLWLGRIAPWKGLHVVLDALQVLSGRGVDATLTVAGAPIHEGAQYTDAIHARVAAEGLRVRFLGHVDDVPELLARHDVLVHSSVLPEPFGQVVIQGMAAGLAVVATSAGGPAEVINDGADGLLVPPGDEVALADTLRRLLTDSSLVDRIGMAARARALSNFTDDRLASGLDSLITDLYRQIAA
jgi:glycosyltransferase involved in cell wall biosynthesis